MWSIIIGIGFIIAGLSGVLVLRGTDSGIALAGFGVVLVLWGAMRIVATRILSLAGVNKSERAKIVVHTELE